jgi:hypothetical protein
MPERSSGTMSSKIVIPDAAIRAYNEKYGHLLPKVKKPSSIPDYLDEDKLYEQYLLLNKNSE